MTKLKLVHRDTLSCETILRRAPNGDLLIVSQCGDITEPAPLNRVYLFRSTDDGKTWSAGQKLYPEDGNAVYATEMTVIGDEIAVYLTVHTGYFCRCKNVVIKSRDNGYTWSEPTVFPDWQGFTFVRGVLTLKNGTLLLPYQHYPVSDEDNERLDKAKLPVWESDTANVYNGVFASTDGGKTWARRGENSVSLIGADGKKCWQWTEPTLAELTDGTVVMLLRVRGGGCLWRSESEDGGFTWSSPERTEIPNPGNKPKLIQDGKRILLLNTPNDKYGFQYRTPLTVWESKDDMRSWKEYVVSDFQGWLSYPDGIVEGNTVRFAFELNRHDVYYAVVDLDD